MVWLGIDSSAKWHFFAQAHTHPRGGVERAERVTEGVKERRRGCVCEGETCVDVQYSQ